MKQELDRVKNDVETIQRAMGLMPSFKQEWIQWLKRNCWFSLWWCLPGLLLVASTLLPLDHDKIYFGLAIAQWTGILVAASLLGIAVAHTRQVTGEDGRQAELIRESRRFYGMTGQGTWFGLACLVQLALYFAWSRHYHLAFEPFWAGLFLLMGSTFLVAALSAKAWILLGYALPFMAYGFCRLLTEGHPKVNGVLLGMMFIAVGLLFSLIQVCQIRRMERQHESH